MRFRQVHLDFHTSEMIENIGSRFDETNWQQTLQAAAVDSITCFSVCHHGWSYHPTQVGQMHPQLNFNLLRRQIDACHAIDIKVPVYISAGANEMIARSHPEWIAIDADGRQLSWVGGTPLNAGFKSLCFNSPYVDYLVAVTEETLGLFPDADGLFFDIVLQFECCCPRCVADMLALGLDPADSADRRAFARRVLMNYYRRIADAIARTAPGMPVFHNSGHISSAHPEILPYFSHLELESLPTGGWGYDHFPQSAAFARKTGLDFSGMTGKFHLSWGEFGGIKHPNALRYECAAMLALGAKCSIGDQLHPLGELDATTYQVIGEAYREVQAKEPWCIGAVNLADIAVISAESCGLSDTEGDAGVGRILLEGHFLFDFITPEMDISGYKMVILPDNIPVSAALQRKLEAFPGKILFSGASGFDCGVAIGEESGFDPTYLVPAPEFAPEFSAATPFVIYGANRKVQPPAGATRLGDVQYPYFNRSFAHFCSHRHTPNRLEPSGDGGGFIQGRVGYFAHRVFSIYRRNGAVALRQYITKVIERLLGADRSVATDLPSCARLTLCAQEKRHILHLLYANIVKRGDGVEVIEELLPLHQIHCQVRCPREVKKVYLAPQMREIPFVRENGFCSFEIEQFTCHQMAVLEY